MAARKRRCPVTGRDHRYVPSASGGYHADGSAKVWGCECSATIRFQPWPPVTVGRAR